MNPNDVIERYEEVKEQVDQMDEEEISILAEHVAATASTIDDPADAIAKRVVEFFEQKKISPEARILGVRALSKNMAGKLISERLAILLAADIDKVPKGFWDKDNDNGLLMEIDVCNDTTKLLRYIRRSDTSKRVKRAAAMKAYRLATSVEDKTKFALLKEKYSD